MVAAVIAHDTARRRVALVQRAHGARFAPGLWDLPGGKRESYESVAATAIRELREETGLLVDSGNLELAHVIHGARGVDAPTSYLTVVFATYDWSGELSNREPEKHAQARWMPTDALPPEFVPSTGGALRQHLRGQRPSFALRGWDAEA
ncbi:DNA mismatch repair protein MutT [Streptomyces oceani]|uniref:DNA mismatch repair protein MutT n=1 Tax=Streptomyces oceani TaxID=1075402 RepID=A0A1E7KIE8_9ACTN|nr:DNA mismatch repair protein MutT [Streptomyces oceani]